MPQKIKATNLFGTEENEGLVSEKLSANWKDREVDFIFVQAGLINVRDEA